MFRSVRSSEENEGKKKNTRRNSMFEDRIVALRHTPSRILVAQKEELLFDK